MKEKMWYIRIHSICTIRGGGGQGCLKSLGVNKSSGDTITSLDPLNTVYQYIKILVVCRVCVTDVGVAVTNLRVVCQIITCVPAGCHRNVYKSFRAIY